MNTENTIKNIELFEILKSNDLTGKICSTDTINILCSYIRNKIVGQSGIVEIENILKSKITGYCTTTNKKWRDSRRHLSKFLKIIITDAIRI